jgi:hypothetical protein
MNITLAGIPQGHWRDLTESEMEDIYRLTKDSSSEATPKKKSGAAPAAPAPAKKKYDIDPYIPEPMQGRKSGGGRPGFSNDKPFSDRPGKRAPGGAPAKGPGGAKPKGPGGSNRNGGKPKPPSGGGGGRRGGGRSGR